jgi:hypothetical protein
MTEVRNSSELATQGADARRSWIRPAVQLLAAGSAENSAGPATDATTTPS